MDSQYTYSINKDKINESINTLNNIDNSINSVDLSDNFIEIEEIIKTTNFNHNNCISNYKDDINFMIEELAKIKRRINKLTDSLSNTIVEFSSSTELKSSDVENILNYYNEKRISGTGISFDSNAFKAAETNLVAAAGGTEINTVPIGLGIAAAGVTASVGAVVADSITEPKQENIEQYHEKPQEVKYDYDNLQKVEQQRMEFPKDENVNNNNPQEVVEETPYLASRNDSEVMNKFYDETTNQESQN